jgi:uncharacterized tellurite resistance protein B-like protein
MEDNLKNRFLSLYHMVLADTKIELSELAMLYSIGEEYGITKEDIASLLLDTDSRNDYIPNTLTEKVDVLFDLARIAWSDGIVDNSEKELMSLYAKKFDFKDENISTIVQFLLDEVQKGTTKEEVLNFITKNI